MFYPATKLAILLFLTWFINLTSGNDHLNRLLIAARLGEIKTMNSLLKMRMSEEAKMAALCTALEHKREDLANFLIEKGVCDFSKGGIHGRENPMHLAVKNDMQSCVELLLQKGADVDAGDQEMYRPLHHAVCGQNVALVRLLLSKGAEVNAQNNMGDTPLRLSMLHTSEEIMRILLDAGADINKFDVQMQTPLHYAARVGHKEILDILLTHRNKPKLDAKNIFGYTPLFLATIQGTRYAIRALVAAGADTTTEDSQRNTPIHYALCRKDEETVEDLLSGNGLQVNKRNKTGDMPLHVAIKFGSLNIVKKLLAAGADVNAGDPQQQTSLHLAVRRRDKDFVDILLKSVNMNEMNNFGETALDCALAEGMPSVIIALIEAGADISTCDPGNLLEILSKESHKLVSDFDTTAKGFDEYLAEITNAYLASLGKLEYSKDLKSLAEEYENCNLFSLYRVIKAAYWRMKAGRLLKPSVLEENKFYIFDETIRKFRENTYMEKLPLDLISDALYSGNYGWKVERVSWALTMASHNLNTRKSDAKLLAPELLRSY